MAIPRAQAEIANFLRNLTGHAPVETHISAIFVGERDVYKLKKAVRLAFLDFVSLPARRDMARREFELNRVAAPEMYRGVSAIVRAADGTLRLEDDEAAHALDYAVHMAPVPAGDFFENIVARRALTPEELDALGDCVADLHAQLPPIEGWDSPGGLRRIFEGNVIAAREAHLPEWQIADLQVAIGSELERVAPVLRTRAQHGRVRRLHGDLHLGNLCLWHGRPIAFDQLEFDEAMATGDVAYDLAFLLMDVGFRCGRAAANRVMNRYVARTGDAGLLACLPLMMAMRAFIRAHVQATRGVPSEAEAYLGVAFDALRPAPAMLVAIGGAQGSGKTTLARDLAPEIGRPPGACLLRSDEIRKRIFNALPEEKLPAAAYLPASNARVSEAMLRDVQTALAAGQATVADSTFLHPPFRHAMERAAKDAGVAFVGLWLEAALEIRVQRAASRVGDASDAGPDIVRQADKVDPGAITWHRIASADQRAALAAAREKLPVESRSAAACLGAPCTGPTFGSGVHGRHNNG